MRSAKELKQSQRYFRSNPTKAEAVLLENIKQVYDRKDLKFQAIVGYYLPDFIIVPKMLIIEVDGPSHDNAEAYDLRRTAFLQKCGFKLVRFSNEEVLAAPARLTTQLLDTFDDLPEANRLFRSALGRANARRGHNIAKAVKLLTPSAQLSIL